ncbi:hypothetical protein GCM10010922_15680 [Microbacterium sorbitolivorans]|uniref:hypothetical protein n=1 Tax=Microbacterium sorbitolivorans TaxID=1867410 RepID=UPI001650E72E|nr:hypothetical protein [Microbacterium sorbitolivorans]GGF41107.1 hypothetical protein GCM10010922_15680 [Microbacterium sorbitolivorans]
MSDPSYEGISDEDYGRLTRRNRRIRGIAWIVVAALIVGGGGSTILLALFG